MANAAPHTVTPSKRKETENMRLSRLAGERLQKTRTALGIKIYQVVAAFPGRIQKSHLSEWEHGEKPIPMWALRELAMFYGVSTDYLLCATDSSSELKHSLEINEMMHTVGQHYWSLMASKISGSIGQHAAKLHCYEEAVNSGVVLVEQIDRMIELNRKYFESEIRNGARVESALSQAKAAFMQAQIAGRRHRLVELTLPTELDDAIQTRLDLQPQPSSVSEL